MFFKRRYVPVDADTSSRTADTIIDWFRDFTNTRLNSRLMDERRAFSPQLILELGNRGVFGMTAPKEYGGQALRFRDWTRVLAQFTAVDISLANFVTLSLGPGIRSIASFGQPRVKDEFLPGLAAGRIIGGFGQTEPGAGTNFQALATTATAMPGGKFRLSGEKLFIGNAGWSTVLTVMARLKRQDGTMGGLTAFAVPTHRRGVVIDHEIMTMGLRGFVHNYVHFHDVEVDQEMILGEPEKGMDVALDNMSFSRVCIAAGAVACMRRCAQLAHRFASRRTVASGQLLASPISLTYFSEVISMAAVLEALVDTMTGILDAGRDIPIEAPIVGKVAASELCFEATDGLVQVLGGRGYDEANIVPQMVRDTRITRIFEGASEPLLLFLGQRAHQKTSGIYELLRFELKSPAIADQLKGIVEELSKRTWEDASPLSPATTAQEWRFYLAGQLSLWAILQAAAIHRLQKSEAKTDRVALEWVRLRFEQAKNAALAGSAREKTMLGVADIEQAVQSCVASIGDLEQTFAGENYTLDPWLRKNYSSEPV